MNPRRCIISYASFGREPYPLGLPRIIDSAKRNGHGWDFNNCFLILSPDYPGHEISGVSINKMLPSYIDFPSHQKVPYGFKPWLFKIAFDLGLEQVLWCDSTIVIHKPLDRIWQIAEERGLFVGRNPGCPMRVWTSDDAMDQMGCPYKEPHEAMFDEIAACALAIDIRHETAKKVFKEWFTLCNDGVTFAGRGGSTRPDFRAHRHDQSAMSWLCQKYKVDYEPYGVLCYHSDIPKFPEHILANTGIGI